MGRLIELRVHGVSGTSAEALLGVHKDDLADPPPAGDKYVQFARPREEDDDHVLEGMSWGSLTSGAVVQALWLLLLPFALANLAYWARPWEDRDKPAGMGAPEPAAYRGDPTLASVHRILVRAVALGLTAIMVFTTASISLDMLAWQCWVTGSAPCTSSVTWLGWLDAGAQWSIGASLTVGLLAPLALIAGLLVLSARATLVYETYDAGLSDGDGGDDPHLFSRRMWQSDVLVTRLRDLHVATALIVTAVIALRMCAGVGASSLIRSVVAALCLTGVVVVGVLLLSERWLRWTHDAPAVLRALGHRLVLWGPPLAALAVEVAWLLLAAPVRGNVALQHVPGLIDVGHWVVLGAIAVLLGLAAVHGMARWRLGPRFGLPDAGVREDGSPVLPASRGAAAWLIASMSVIVGFGFSSALALRAADLTGAAPLPAFDIAAGATGLFVVLAVIWGILRIGPAWRQSRKRATGSVRGEYAAELDSIFPDGAVRTGDYRVRRVVRPRTVADLVSFDRLGGLFLVAGLVGIASGIYSGLNAAYTLATYPEVPPLLSTSLGGAASVMTALQPLGSWVVTLFALGLIAAGVAAWRSERARRLVGIIWDITCFWPRAAHPFAPPCYAERAIPQLACRLSHLSGKVSEDDGAVVLAGHSQGSVIAVAALAQLSALDATHPDCNLRTDRISLLTFGSPVMRLYIPVFPRLFWPTRLLQLEAARQGRWTSLWRATDPVGSSLQPVLHAAPATGEHVIGDVRFIDPTQLRMVPERSAYAPVHGHVDYEADPRYAVCVDDLALAARTTSPHTTGTASTADPRESFVGDDGARDDT